MFNHIRSPYNHTLSFPLARSAGHLLGSDPLQLQLFQFLTEVRDFLATAFLGETK
jgi:hypothetical protein